MNTITLKIGGMSCMGCVNSVKRVLEGQPGVTQADVDLAAATATLTFDPERTNAAELRGIITDAGYPVAD
jgi:copper chaperone